ncbi:MerR family transcriptional regulator [Streptomyces sp. NBC_00237]|uniref:MerR family transcriptional regulator n=1 Tax=Streptomyces sp. NBC_00237 TaxID=2975687 RepID=UPI00224EA596|nr:MerR family transcriptional regulator [Streptomyces sp. NBC_00237]MCX5201856.1 MerR family transcriptional regulator [Streptomyces sp. NBC_00237]
MKIGELSKATGVSVRLLRYYEEQELLAATRTGGGHRSYAPDAPQRVRRIRAFLGAGLPTRIIRQILDCACGAASEVEPCLGGLLHEQLRAVEERVAELQEAREALVGLLAELEGLEGPVRVAA